MLCIKKYRPNNIMITAPNIFVNEVGKKTDMNFPTDMDIRVPIEVTVAIIRLDISPIFIFLTPYAIPITKLSKLEDRLYSRAERNTAI